MRKVAAAIRRVTSIVQKEIAAGGRTTQIDAEDVVQILLAVADHLDPPFGGPVDEADACPHCGERESDNLVWQDDESVRCAKCGKDYRPAG
ncbi:MAG: hypothetical protein IT428_29705 [Planctomycetaceae bacterium]|nr:hypothetical protein [Planctomycetaceae bacterium]